MKKTLVGFVRVLQYEIFNPKIAETGVVIKRGPDHCKWFTWNVVGNLAVANPRELALSVAQRWTELQDRSKAPVQPVIATPKPEETLPLIRGYCTYILPPTWVGKLPQPDYMQKLYGVPIYPSFEFQTQTTYRQKVVGIGINGQIAIGEPDKITCMTYLNEIMSTASLLGLPMMTVRESDMGEMDMTEKGQIRSISYPTSSSRQQLSQMEFGGHGCIVAQGFPRSNCRATDSDYKGSRENH